MARNNSTYRLLAYVRDGLPVFHGIPSYCDGQEGIVTLRRSFTDVKDGAGVDPAVFAKLHPNMEIGHTWGQCVTTYYDPESDYQELGGVVASVRTDDRGGLVAVCRRFTWRANDRH